MRVKLTKKDPDKKGLLRYDREVIGWMNVDKRLIPDQYFTYEGNNYHVWAEIPRLMPDDKMEWDGILNTRNASYLELVIYENEKEE